MKNIIKWVLQIDSVAYAKYITEVKNGNLKTLNKICSFVGLPIPLLTTLAIISYLGYQYVGYKAMVIIITSYTFSSFINLLIKACYKRDRPPNNNFRSPIPFDKYSFPSGHSAGTMAVAISLSHFVPELWLMLISWSILMGLSRFFGDFHHLTDIVAGFMVGICSSLLLIKIIPMLY